jgi:hypothetical protein
VEHQPIFDTHELGGLLDGVEALKAVRSEVLGGRGFRGNGSRSHFGFLRKRTEESTPKRAA